MNEEFVKGLKDLLSTQGICVDDMTFLKVEIIGKYSDLNCQSAICFINPKFN